MAGYYFSSATVDGENLTSDDWVGAFNGEICIGARRWGDCGDDWCDVSAMGFSSSDNWTVGYMQPGDIPIFQIYDASNNIYYDAVYTISDFDLDGEFGWYNMDFNFADNLIAECNYYDECGMCGGDNYNCESSDVNCDCEGCTDDSACNYNSGATIDDGSCWYSKGNYDCTGNCLVEPDCAGNCCVLGEDGCLWQETGPCGEPVSNNGTDSCGVCGGDNSSCADCSGVPCSNAYEDNCGICDSDPSNDCGYECGSWGGDAFLDECGVCYGDGTSCIILGDLNSDDEINIIDIVMAVDIILVGNYNAVGDVNEDGQLNVIDIVVLVDWVLNGMPEMDSDGDGVLDDDDSDPNNPYQCSDVDIDTCEDCSTGMFNPSEDGADNDSDGACDAGDDDDDNDGCLDSEDEAPNTWNHDYDGDGTPDDCDCDDDNDGCQECWEYCY